MQGGKVLNITVIGAGNSGLTMAAHLSSKGESVRLWNRSAKTIEKLMETSTVHCKGLIEGAVKIDLVTDDIQKAIFDTDIIFVATPASSHKDIAIEIAKNIRKETIIVLNPGRTFGALEFKKFYNRYNTQYKQKICETQTIIYTCRKTGVDSIDLISLKSDVLISSIDSFRELENVNQRGKNERLIGELPESLREYFVPANSMIETSIGNVGMILHCAPLLLNAGWTENENNAYKYYYDGITPSVAKFIEKVDQERVWVSERLGLKVETTKEWMKRTYGVRGETLYDCIQNNEAYTTIDAPDSLDHRYIKEDIPCGLVPLESIGKKLGLEMKTTKLIIDLANILMDTDFRSSGRNLDDFSFADVSKILKKSSKKQTRD